MVLKMHNDMQFLIKCASTKKKTEQKLDLESMKQRGVFIDFLDGERLLAHA